jgi:hypothetical protein
VRDDRGGSGDQVVDCPFLIGVYRHRSDQYLRPAIDSSPPPSLLMTWWLLLYNFSMLASYEPRRWTKLLDPDKASTARLVQYALGEPLIVCHISCWTGSMASRICWPSHGILVRLAHPAQAGSRSGARPAPNSTAKRAQLTRVQPAGMVE